MSDIVAAIDRFLALPSDQLADGIFNVGSTRFRTLLELAEIVQQEYAVVSGTWAPIQTGIDDAPDPPLPHLDMSRAAAAGFVPRDDVHGEIRQILAVAGGTQETALGSGQSR